MQFSNILSAFKVKFSGIIYSVGISSINILSDNDILFSIISEEFTTSDSIGNAGKVDT